ncbi:MAG: MFS transporter [Chloroflexi bacterium]|nr:MFS transporter [Chloroflexota bacterium]
MTTLDRANAETAQTRTMSGATVSRYRWVIVAALVAGSWSMSVPSISFGVMLPRISDTLHLSDLQKGWLGSSLRIGNVLVTVPVAMYFSRFNPVRLTAITLAFSALFTFMQGLAPAFAVLFVARMGFGLSFSMRTPARAIIAHQWFPLNEIAFMNGLTIGLGSIAEATTLALTPLILGATDSWRATYYIFGSFVVAVLAFWLLFARSRQSATREAEERLVGPVSLRRVMRYKEVWLIGLGGMGASYSWWVFGTFWPTYMLEQHGVSVKQSGWLFAMNSTGTLPASLLLGLLASRLGHRRLILVGCGLLMFGASLGLLATTSTPLLAVLMFCAGMGWGYMPVAQAIPYELPGLEPRGIAVALSIQTAMLFMGGVLGPVMTGAISDTTESLRAALTVGAVSPLLLVVSALLLGERPRVKAVA